VSVALGAEDRVLASRVIEIAHSSEALLRCIDEVLSESSTTLQELDGLVALRGPGSFTGLRVGLATLLGLHQALRLPAVAVPTLDVLRLAAPSGSKRTVTVVDALRGEWFTRLFVDGQSVQEARIISVTELDQLNPDCVVGHGAAGLAAALPGVRIVDSPELAPLALRFLCEQAVPWSESTLLDPLYLRPPAVRAN